MGTIFSAVLGLISLLISVVLSSDLGPNAKAFLTAGGLAAIVFLVIFWIRRTSKN